MNPLTIILLGVCIAIVAFFSRKQKPKRVEIFLDISGSMPITKAMEDIVEMLGEMRQDIQVSFSTFSQAIQGRFDFNTTVEASLYLNDKPFVLNLLQAAGGGTDYTCISKAVIQPYDYVFVITDEAEDCRAKLSDLKNLTVHSCLVAS